MRPCCRRSATYAGSCSPNSLKSLSSLTHQRLRGSKVFTSLPIKELECPAHSDRIIYSTSNKKSSLADGDSSTRNDSFTMEMAGESQPLTFRRHAAEELIGGDGAASTRPASQRLSLVAITSLKSPRRNPCRTLRSRVKVHLSKGELMTARGS
jgi:hypothetical protein